MDTRFKWDMFITSFIPLWVTIIIYDMWDIIEYIIPRWHHLHYSNFHFIESFNRFAYKHLLLIGTIVIVLTIVSMSIIDLTLFLKNKQDEPTSPKAYLNNISHTNKLSAEYLLAYVLPMIAFDFTTCKDILLFVIYFLFLAYICIRNNNIYTNIYFELKKYRMFECDVTCKIANRTNTYKNSLVISKNNLATRTGGEISYWDFDNHIFIDLDK